MVKTVFRSGNSHPISNTLTSPKEQDWQKVRDGVKSLEGKTSEGLEEQIFKAASDGRISSQEYFGRGDSFSIANKAVGIRDGSISSAMKDDMSLGRLRFGDVDTFDIVVAKKILTDSSVELDPKVRADLEKKVSAFDSKLKSGEILSGAFVDSTGAVHELAQGRVEVDYDKFVKTMPPENWSPNLARYNGGEVRELERVEQGPGSYQIKQQERMSIDQVPNNLDMTKNTVVDVDPEGARVSWHVFHSDPTKSTLAMKSVIQDDGYIDFKRTEDGKVLVTTHSKHKIETPSSKLGQFFLGRQTANELVGQMGLRSYFTDVIANYRAIAEGHVEPTAFHRDPANSDN